MYSKGIFVFGSKIFDNVTKRDAISSLPLELTWKIFSYLDDSSLRRAYHLHKIWARIISANKKLYKRLNNFELAIKLGSKSLAKFHRRNMKNMKKEKKKQKKKEEKNKHYLKIGGITNHSTKKEVFKLKRQGEEMVIHTKRFKLC